MGRKMDFLGTVHTCLAWAQLGEWPWKNPGCGHARLGEAELEERPATHFCAKLGGVGVGEG